MPGLAPGEQTFSLHLIVCGHEVEYMKESLLPDQGPLAVTLPRIHNWAEMSPCDLGSLPSIASRSVTDDKHIHISLITTKINVFA